MRKLRILGSILICLALLGVYLFPEQPISANGQAPRPTEGVPSKNPNYGEGITGGQSVGQIVPLAMQYFKVGKASIERINTNILSVGGSTEAYIPVDTVAVSLYLQIWDAANSQWVDIAYAGTWQNYNSKFVLGGVDIQVPRGYYYRTRAHHWVVEGGVVEQVNNYTSYIYMP